MFYYKLYPKGYKIIKKIVILLKLYLTRYKINL